MAFDVREYAKKRTEDKANGNKSSGGFDVREYAKQRNLPQVGEYINSSINDWLKKNESFYAGYNDRIGRYQDKDVLDWSYESDSSDWLSSLTTQKGNLEKEASEIKTWLNQYKNYLSEDYYNSVIEALDGNLNNYGDILSQATDINKHWSAWDTEDAYKEWVAQQNDYNEKLSYDLEAGKKELGTLKGELQTFKDSIGFWGQVGAEAADLGITFGNEEGISNHNRIEELTSQISEKEMYITNAERIQNAAKLASVADPNSGNYDVEFDKYANQGMSFTNPSINEAEKGNVPVNKAVYARDNADMIGIGEANGGGSNIVKYYHSYMTDEEVRTYSYYFGKGDYAKADEYLASLEESLQTRHGTDMGERLKGNLVLEYAFGVAAGLDQFTSGVKGIFADDYTPISATQVASGIVREDLADTGAKLPDWLGGGSLGQVGYDVITTTSNMLPSILVGAAVTTVAPGAGAAIGAGLLGASAGGGAKAEMLNLGYSKEQANTYGVMVAVAEAGMEYLLGGIGALGGKLSGKAVSTIASKVDNAIARVAIKLGNKGGSILKAIAHGATSVVGNMASEALEEGLQTVIEPWLKEIATGVDWDDPSIDEVLYSSLLGALSAFGLEGAGIVVGEVNTYKQGKNIQNVYAGVEKLQNIGTTYFSADTVAYKIASKVNAQTDAYTIGRLLSEVGGTLSEQNVTDITNGLVNRGVPLKEAKKLAKQYQAILSQNMNISDSAIAILEAVSPLADVLREEIVEKNTTVLQRTRQFGELLDLADEVANRKKAKTSNKTGETSAQEAKNASVTENATVKENATESEFEASADGKTIDKKTGKEVSVAEIVSNEGGNLMVKLDNGETVNARDLSYATAEEGLLYEMAAKMGVDPNTAMALVKAYNPASGVKAQTYAIDIPLAYEYGKIGNKKGLEKLNLTPEQSATAYVLGRDNAKAEANSQNAALRESLKQAAEKSEATASDKKQVKGRVRFEYGAKAKGKAQRHIVNLAKVLSNALGVDFYFYDSTIDGTPESQSNGYFNPKDNSIHLDLQNSMTDAKTIAYSMSHELVHFIKKWSPAKFEAFADFLMEQYGEHGVDTDAMLQRMMGKLGTDDVNEAFEEMVCEACEKMLLDSNAAVKLAQLRAKDAGLFEKIKTHILDILNKIRTEYKKYSPSSEEAQALDKMGDVMEKFYSLFEDMAVDAAQTYQEAVGLNAESVVMSKDGTIKMQMKQYEQTGRTTLYNYLREQYGESDAKNLISTIDNIYNVLKEVKQNEALSVFSTWQDTEIELDEEGHPIFTTSINNGDYELNQDFSRVCKKRRQLDFVLNMLAEDPSFEASNLTKQDFVKINKAIKAHGFEIACALCFVDSKRFRQAEWADSFANTWNDILNAVVTDSGKLTPFNFATKTPNISDDGIEIDTSKEVTYRKWSDGKEDVKNRRTYESFDQILAKDQDGKWLEGNANVRTIATLLRDHPELRHTFRGADIIASQGFDTIQRLAPGIRSILDGWGGSSVPKPSSNDASYDSSIINSKGYNKETAYAMGGVRMNSFSDFMAHMFFDYCQAFADLSAKELPSQAYTKELTFVRFFGRSGQKINMSGIAAIRDNALPTVASKNVSKAEAEANEKIEKMVAGLDITRLLEHLNKDIYQLTENDVEQFLDMCDYVWADESINMKHATLLQTGILYDKLSESKIEECYELLKAGEIEEALKVAGEENVDTEYAKHCGTIVVGVSDAHIRKLLRDSTVRMVIPYHKSGLNPVIARELRIAVYNDYTTVQNTGAIRKGTNSRANLTSEEIKKAYGLKDFAFYDWFGKTIDGKLYDGKATADKYLEWCEKGYYDESVGDYVYYTTKQQGYILASELHKKLTIDPKFSSFVGEENYYKLLEDFDCYNTITGEHSAQGAVDFLRNGLPSDYKTVLMDALTAEQKVHDDFRDHLDNKGLKEEIMEIAKPKTAPKTIEGVKRQLKNTNKITLGMTDSERSEILKSKNIVAPIYEGQADEAIAVNKKDLESQKLGLVKAALVRIGDEFKVFTDYNIKDVEVKITLSRTNLKESISKDASPVQLAKLLPVLKDAVGNAIGIESHSNRYYYDADTVYFDNLIGGYVDGDLFVPVRFGLKHSKMGTTTLYVVVDQNKVALENLGEIKNDRDRKDATPDLTGDSNLLSSVTHSISQIVPFVNSKDLLRYLPDDMLNAEQKKIKWEGIAETIKTTDKKNDKKYKAFIESGNLRSAQQMVVAAARAAGYTVEGWHGTGSEKFHKFNFGRSGIYLSSDEDIAKTYGKNVMHLFANTENQLVVDADGHHFTDIPVPDWLRNEIDEYPLLKGKSDSDTIATVARRLGYSSVKIANVSDSFSLASDTHKLADDYVYFESLDDWSFKNSQVKSADTITYDDNGNIIPLSERFNSENNDIRYQKKTASTRSLLANALESTAQNDIERNKLEQYKSKIDLIELEYAKLAEIKKQANDIRFTKGRTAAETKKMKALDFEANQIANRINVYDRQLFNLESTTALKNVLQREKELARKKEAQKGKEALAKRREREAKTIRTLMEKNTESRKKGIEGRNKTEMRHKIKSIVSEINTLLLNPTSKKHIKEELRKGVADALSAINMDTVGADERVAMYNDLIAKEKNPDVIAELTKTRDRIQLQGDKLKDKLNTLQAAYEKIKNSDDIELNLAYQEVIYNSIKAVSEKVGDTSIRNMTFEQLEMVYDLFKMIQHTIREANKSFKTKKGETITQMAEAVNDQVRTVGGQPYKRNAIVAAVQRVGWTFLKPLVAFRTIGSTTFTNMYKELRNGEDTFYNDVNEAQAFIEAQYEKHGYKSWDMKKTKTFTAKSGKTFALTLEQMMTLYAYSRRDQAHKHIIEGGIVFEDAMVVEKNKWGVPIKYEVTTKDAFNLSEETFAEIANSLTAEQKAFVDEMQHYLSITMGAKGNEVSMELLGVKLFKEEFYLPIKSSQYYRNFSAEEAGEVKLKSPAFSKETVKHANNPIVLHNFTDLWAEHINDMSMYHSFVLALEDFTRVYNYKTKTDANVETMDTKATLETAYPGVTKYISKFLKDMNGGVRSETVGWAEKLTSLSKKGAVLGSASVAIQQPSAVMRAMAFINPKYFVISTPESINLAKHKQDWAELKKYAPIAGIKEMGRFDVGMGQGTVDWIQSNKTVMEKVEDGLSIAPAFMDEITWVSIWNAVKRETVSKHKDLTPNSDAFLNVAGERFTEVISLSQVYDSVFSRSDLMRNRSLVAKWITAFMAEPTTTLNMIWDSWVQGTRSGSAKGFAKATSVTGGAIVASIVLNSALKAIVMGMRDDDEDESYIEKYLESFFGDLKDNLNPLTLVPAVKDVISIFNGYNVDRMDMALFSDLKKAIDAFDSDNKTAYEKWSGLIGAISAFFGVPVKNVERDVRGVINTVFGDKVETTSAGLTNAIVAGWTGEDKSKAQNLYNAIISGDQAHIERLKSQYKDEKAFESAIKQALRENDSRIKKAAKALASGNVRDYSNTLDTIVSEGHFDEDMVASAIRSELSAFNTKINKAAEAKNKGDEEEYKKIVRDLRDSYKGVYSQDDIVNLIKKAQDEKLATDDDEDVEEATSIYKASDINSAFENGDTDTALEVIDDLISTKVANGMTEKEAKSSIRSSMTSYWKPLYKEAYKSGNTAEKERIERILKASGLYGSASEVIKTCREWRTERD